MKSFKFDGIVAVAYFSKNATMILLLVLVLLDLIIIIQFCNLHCLFSFKLPEILLNYLYIKQSPDLAFNNSSSGDL